MNKIEDDHIEELVNEGENEEPEICPHCDDYTDTDGNGRCLECGWLPHEDVECRFCGEELHDPTPSECEKCGESVWPWLNYDDFMKLTTDDKILHVLNRNESLTFGEIAKKVGMTEKKSTLTYRLRRLSSKEIHLINKSEIKGQNPTYSRVTTVDNRLDAEILEFLTSDDYKARTFSEIQDHIAQKNVGGNKTILLITLNETLPKLGQIRVDEKEPITSPDGETIDQTTYSIPFWRLPDAVCHYCRKEFQGNELVINQISMTEADTIESYPIHATCRSKTKGNKVPYDDSDVCCDYCGLELIHRHISLALREPTEPNGELSNSAKIQNQQVIKNYESAVATLYDDPYSKIFSCLDASNDSFASLYYEKLDPIGYSSHVSKDGKKYHPYCAKRVETL